MSDNDKTWTLAFNPENGCSEITPDNDLHDHTGGPMCECSPRVELVASEEDEDVIAGVIISHNAFDGRDIIENVTDFINQN